MPIVALKLTSKEYIIYKLIKKPECKELVQYLFNGFSDETKTKIFALKDKDGKTTTDLLDEAKLEYLIEKKINSEDPICAALTGNNAIITEGKSIVPSTPNDSGARIPETSGGAADATVILDERLYLI